MGLTGLSPQDCVLHISKVWGRTGERVVGVKGSAPGGCEKTPRGPEEAALALARLEGPDLGNGLQFDGDRRSEPKRRREGIFSQEPSGCRVQAPAGVPHIKHELQGPLTTNPDVRWNGRGP